MAIFFRVKNQDEAVALANDSDFGLGGSVFTADVARGKRVASRVDTGMMFVNQPTWTRRTCPSAASRHSGYGHELSNAGHSGVCQQEADPRRFDRCRDLYTAFRSGGRTPRQSIPFQ